jgi:undecaprenyl-diphosphatase
MIETKKIIKKLRSRVISRVIAFSLLVCLGGAGLSANGFSADSMDFIQPFSLNPVNDGIQLGLGTALSGSALICDKFVHLKKNSELCIRKQ